MSKYTLEMRDDQCIETREIEADTIDDARDQAEAETREWLEGGDWGTEGASVDAHWSLYAAEDEDQEDELDTGHVTVEIEPDHVALIRAATERCDRSCGNDPDDHDWTSEGEGGCTENPGVWSTGGTAMVFASHCKECGLQRRSRSTGSQRNPGEHDTVSYAMPESWCAECESEECSCEPTGPWIVVRQDTLEGWDADAAEWVDRISATEYADQDEAMEAAVEVEDELGRLVTVQVAMSALLSD